jgi:hypothetical protein
MQIRAYHINKSKMSNQIFHIFIISRLPLILIKQSLRNYLFKKKVFSLRISKIVKEITLYLILNSNKNIRNYKGMNNLKMQTINDLGKS